MSHFLAGIDSRVLGALADHCKALRTGEITCELQHLSLQFGGGEILLAHFPENSKSPAESAIKAKSGFDVNLVEKEHRFSLENVSVTAIRAEMTESPRLDLFSTNVGTVFVLV